MAGSPERRGSPQPRPEDPQPAEVPPSKSELPPSPTRSDKSSDSEGRPVREKLKETRIDAHTSSDAARSSDQPMNDAPNGTDVIAAGDQSTSGSESGRGRLRRKRSREDFEDEEKPVEKKHERHARKKSRDVTSPQDADAELSANPLKSPITRIDEQDGDETMSSDDDAVQSQILKSNGPTTPPATGASNNNEPTIISPKNKRTREEAKTDRGLGVADDAPKSSNAATKAEEERSPKRHRDKSDAQLSPEPEEGKTKIPPGSGFANTSVASPFASLSSKSKASSAPEKPTQGIPQTTEDKFKASGFGSFAASPASPFGIAGSSSSSSVFAPATSGSKLTSFTSPSSTSSSTPSGFGALGSSSSKSAFGGSSAAIGGSSVFGGSLGQSGFGGLGGSKTGVPSFATPGSSTITGLSQKPVRPFGASGDAGSEDEEDDYDENDEDDQDNEDTERSKSTDAGKRLNPVSQEVETGEENEQPTWTGRAKLYTIAGGGWQERGVGPFKFNITKDDPRKARFILRADGTHRLLLNAAVTKSLKFGDPSGEKPNDGKLLFSSPTADGTIEMHLLKMKAERAAELYDTVTDVKENAL